MTRNGEFYHALTINRELCVGCTHCVAKCPTGALRIRGGKATIRPNWCIDCAECMKSCPVGAIYVEHDDLDRIFDFKCRVALVPSIFLGQFPEKYNERQIFDAIYSLGFTHVFHVEFSCEAVDKEMKRQIAEADDKPAISPFCPAVVRLIQIRFPDLVDNILRVQSPLEASARLYRCQLQDEGYGNKEIGIFYVTPCAAKIATVKGGGEISELVDGVLNMDYLFNRVYKVLRNGEEVGQSGKMPTTLSADEILWSSTSGEADRFEGRSLAVDEIHNVIDFIERMELTGEMSNIDFLEMRACDRSCMGGALTPANRFIASERMQKLASTHPRETLFYNVAKPEYIEKLKQHISVGRIKPMTKLVYQGDDIGELLRKMNSAKQIRTLLPGIDCGACGSPGCESLAEDIVRGEATLSNCVFVQRELEVTGKLSSERACAIVEKVWGKERLSRNIKKIANHSNNDETK